MNTRMVKFSYRIPKVQDFDGQLYFTSSYWHYGNCCFVRTTIITTTTMTTKNFEIGSTRRPDPRKKRASFLIAICHSFTTPFLNPNLPLKLRNRRFSTSSKHTDTICCDSSEKAKRKVTVLLLALDRENRQTNKNVTGRA